ncbi:TIGR03086 family metal-binding protein [Tsukamurella soli]|uniref:TIGR03086 family metal-binding protein n=1 Tax=Tsukamurella soli TaxID=644556 RepID=A0ABP8JX15_9ACTN
MDVTLLAAATGTVAAFTDLITPADLARPSPCEGWDLADLLAHLQSENLKFAAAAGDSATVMNTTVEQSDPTYRSSADAMLTAFRGADDPTQIVTVEPLGPRRLDELYAFQVVDTVVHGWDLATALGLPYAPASATVDLAVRVLRRVPDESRGPGRAFGAAITVPPTGDLREALALAGRTTGEPGGDAPFEAWAEVAP